MITLDITYEEAVALLDRAVEEKGADYVYPRSQTVESCVYFEGEERAPSCIIGHVLEYIDPALKFDPQVEENTSIDTGLLTDWHRTEETTYGASREVRTLFGAAQEQQDGGVPWGEAVAIAKARAGILA